MKKIIAAAVATAFVAPAMAADVTVSGSLTYNYIASDAASIGDKVAQDDNGVTIAASTETNNGYSVSGKFTVIDDGAVGDKIDNQGTAITLTGPIGALSVGDVSGALDNTGDWTDKSPVFGGFDGDGNDAAVLYTLPAFVDGLAVSLSMSPEGVNATANESDMGNSFTGADAGTEGLEHNAFAVTYTTGAFGVYYGSEEEDRTAAEVVKAKAYGIQYSANGIYVAFEKGEAKNIAAYSTYSGMEEGDDLEFQGFAATYALGDITVGVEMQQTEVKVATASTSKVEDETIAFINYNMGGGVSVYAANRSSDSDYSASVTDQADMSAVGVKFAF